ncbi:MAG TPA: class I SAM-dependent methyltransferase [Actinomycetota bacterium]|nr:class I SAM-dependent methyltransferase [Actinomycetota bacterium]
MAEPDGIPARMKQDWNERARTDARYFIAKTTDGDAFEASAEEDIVVLLDGLDNILSPQARVLDVGCGIGRLMKPLAARVSEIHGVDVSGEMIQRAHRYLDGFPNVRLFENNGADLSSLDGPYDFVYSYLMFQHIPDRSIVQRYLHEVDRVLKPGGVFRFQMDGRGDRPFWRAYRAVRSSSSWRGALWTRTAIIDAAQAAGFDVLDCRVDPRKKGLMRYAYVWVTCVKRT